MTDDNIKELCNRIANRIQEILDSDDKLIKQFKWLRDDLRFGTYYKENKYKRQIRKRVRELFWKLVEIQEEEKNEKNFKRLWIGGRIESLNSILKYIKDPDYTERWE